MPLPSLPRPMRRRSGHAFAQFMDLIGYTPRHMVIAGAGAASENAELFREVWPEMEIYGFEPEPRAYRLARGKFPGRLWNHGLWDDICAKTLYVKPGWVDGSSMFPNDDDQAARKEVSVSCVSLDKFFHAKPLGPGGALWLDCEGAELDALHGAEEFIRCIDVVNVELTAKPPGPWASPRAVHDWLLSRGFRAAYIHTIRPWAGQRDCVFLRAEIYDPVLTHIY